MNKQTNTQFSNRWVNQLRLALPLFFFTFLGIPANAIVITSVSINGVQLVSEGSAAAFGLPSNFLIASHNGSFLFNFGLASDPSQNPDEFTFGDSFIASFFSNSGSELQAPDNYSSVTYYFGNIPTIPTSVSFTRQFATAGTFDGGLTVHMSNSLADYYSPFSGYETNPMFHFTLINVPGQVPAPVVVIPTPTPTPTPTPQGSSTHTYIPAGHTPNGHTPLDPPPAFLDTSTPEPGTFGLMIAGALLMAGKLRTGTLGTNRS